MTYTLKLNVPILFILPIPSRTNTEVEENLLYVGDGSQVHEEHNHGEEEGANLHHVTTMPEETLKMKDGHGYKLRLRG